ncbi:hypothetical protein Scep_014162 [Stephania cephalantha]|uniref:Uncharacterized protein n=1 Tax=Stephania cephalantha TaxID=152367 RepID=A0AAP0J0P7_9MAGN
MSATKRALDTLGGDVSTLTHLAGAPMLAPASQGGGGWAKPRFGGGKNQAATNRGSRFGGFANHHSANHRKPHDKPPRFARFGRFGFSIFMATCGGRSQAGKRRCGGGTEALERCGYEEAAVEAGRWEEAVDATVARWAVDARTIRAVGGGDD